MCYQTGSLVLIQGCSGKRPGSGVPVVSVDQGSRIINLEDRTRGKRLDIGHSCDAPWKNTRFHEGSTNLGLIFSPISKYLIRESNMMSF